MLARTLLTLSNAQLTIEAVATVAFAVSGIIEAARKRLDVVGVCMVAGVAAFGGGTLRDILMDRRPLFWVEHSDWLWFVLAASIGAMIFLKARALELTERAMQWPDALGLGLFSASGTQIALDASLPAMVAVLMGVMTAVFGGVVRDIFCNEIPSAFRDHRPYAVCAFLGAWTLVLLDSQAEPQWLALVVAGVVATGLRVMALVTGWRLPTWQMSERDRRDP